MRRPHAREFPCGVYPYGGAFMLELRGGIHGYAAPVPARESICISTLREVIKTGFTRRVTVGTIPIRLVGIFVCGNTSESGIELKSTPKSQGFRASHESVFYLLAYLTLFQYCNYT
jgi:hypothetical protein